MPVTDDMVATVRAYLEVDQERFQQLNAALDKSREATMAYKAMIAGAFMAAVTLKFNKQSSREEIIDYVADVRSRSESMAEALDPSATERMIGSIYLDDDIDDIDARMVMAIEMYIAVAIVTDKGISGPELDDFLATARQYAEKMLSR